MHFDIEGDNVKQAVTVLLLGLSGISLAAEFEGKCQHVHWTPDAVPIVRTSTYAATVIQFPENYTAAEPGDANNWNIKRATGDGGDEAFQKTVIIQPQKDVIEVMPSTTLTVVGESGNVYIFRVRNSRSDGHNSCYHVTANNAGRAASTATTESGGGHGLVSQAAIKRIVDDAKLEAIRTIYAGYTWPKDAPLTEVLDDGRRTIIRFADNSGPATVTAVIDGREAVLSKRFDAINRQYIIDSAPPKDSPAGTALFKVKQGDRSWVITKGNR
jgi:type IV secretory pathway VirB9-like protein